MKTSEDDEYETYLIDDYVEGGTYKVKFQLCSGLDTTFEIIDSSLVCTTSGKNVYEDRKGVCFVENKVYSNISDKVGRVKLINSDDIIEMEADLRSENPEERTLYFFINNIQQKIFFTKLPSRIQFAVYFIIYKYLIYYIVYLFYIYYFFKYISIYYSLLLSCLFIVLSKRERFLYFFIIL